MKIRLLIDPSRSKQIQEELETLGIEIDDQADLILMEKNTNLRFIQGKKRDQVFFIDIHDILYFETLGHDLIIHTMDERYTSNERLKNIEVMVGGNDFLRISNSVIVSIKHIKRIEASLFQKFILHLTNGDKVDVTRSYYYIFKNRIGI